METILNVVAGILFIPMVIWIGFSTADWVIKKMKRA